MSVVFLGEAEKQGFYRAVAQTLYELLPKAVGTSQCFFDKLTGDWRYEFGNPMAVDRFRVFGPNVWHPLGYLVRVLVAARRRLKGEQLGRFVAGLEHKDRHGDWLAYASHTKHQRRRVGHL